jgi:hypothetical protein
LLVLLVILTQIPAEFISCHWYEKPAEGFIFTIYVVVPFSHTVADTGCVIVGIGVGVMVCKPKFWQKVLGTPGISLGCWVLFQSFILYFVTGSIAARYKGKTRSCKRNMYTVYYNPIF